jgi:hypothetical protein
MHLHLYRPVMLSRAGRCVYLTQAEDVSPREAALLVRLRWATYVQDAMELADAAGSPSPAGEVRGLGFASHASVMQDS